jgi:VWFA-related protein
MRRIRSPRAAVGRLLPAVLVAFLSLPLVLAAVAQPTAAERPAAAFGERVDVVLVEVEAVVVDRQGRRVSGLARGDFRLLVDGEPVEIGVFEEVRDGQVALAAAAGAEPPAEATAGDGAAAVPAAAAVAPPAVTRYLVFVDQYFGGPGDRNLVLERLRGDLAQLPPGDPMAVVAWNGRRLEIVTPWTTDRGRLARAFETAAAQRGRTSVQDLRGAVTEEQRQRWIADQLAATYGALTATLQGFSGGGSARSVALVVSGGWPFDPGGGSGRSFRSRLVPDTRKLVRRLAEVANASGFTLYPIDAPGARLDPTVSALVAGLDDDPQGGLQPMEVQEDGSMIPARPLGEPQIVEPLDRTERSFDRAWQEFDGEATLLHLARETGGVALINGQRVSALRQAVADLSSYYRLGFYHSSRADGTVRRIEVEVDRPGLRVRSRRSFADLTTATRAQVSLEQALLLGVAANAEPLAVRLGTARRAGRGKLQVPFEVEIPMGEVTVRPARRGQIATSLELHVAVEDEEGRRNTVATLPIEIETVAAAVGGHVVWEAAVTLRDQGHEVLFALSDPASGRVFVGRSGFDGGSGQ